jgi:hypothetical protein
MRKSEVQLCAVDEVQSMAWTSFRFTPLIEPRPYVFSKIIPTPKLHTQHQSPPPPPRPLPRSPNIELAKAKVHGALGLNFPFEFTYVKTISLNQWWLIIEKMTDWQEESKGR